MKNFPWVINSNPCIIEEGREGKREEGTGMGREKRRRKKEYERKGRRKGGGKEVKVGPALQVYAYDYSIQTASGR